MRARTADTPAQAADTAADSIDTAARSIDGAARSIDGAARSIDTAAPSTDTAPRALDTAQRATDTAARARAARVRASVPRFVVEQRVFASWILALSASLAAWACACGFFSLNDVVPQRADGGPPADARVDAPPADASDGRPPTDCDGGLLAHWTFDEGDGGTVHDTSGNGNDGTFGATPPAWAPGHKGSAVVFARNDAGSEYVNLGSQQVWDIPGAMTVAAWMNLGQQDGDQHLVGKRNQTGCYGQVSWSLGVEMGSSFFQVPLPGLGCTPQRASGPSLPLGQWVHVAGVFRPRQEIDFYQDGVLRQSFATDAGVQGVNYENGAAMRLGSNPGPLGKSDPEQFVGALDEVYVWACALSAEQIAQLAAQ